ncbi:hypothetical protein MPSEU_000988600 [Mayamaea pseudoterrestris]|nr:hypothetical protein MPSEU_000988600 [Mayamaea pseudoterrestris]
MSSNPNRTSLTSVAVKTTKRIQQNSIEDSSDSDDMKGGSSEDFVAAMTTPVIPRNLCVQQHLESSFQPLSPFSMAPSPPQTRCIGGVQVASLFAEPSAYLQQVLRSKAASQPLELCQDRRPSGTGLVQHELAFQIRNDEFILHRACCRSDVTLGQVQQLLLADPMAASRPLNPRLSTTALSHAQMDTDVKTTSTAAASLYTPTPIDSFMYPLNIAITHNARPEAIDALIQAAPHVLSLPDGARLETSLHILLRFAPHEQQVMLEMLLRHPGLASIVDHEGNFPLHVACQSGASSNVIQYLVHVCPDACSARNVHGQTPETLLMIYKQREESR